MLSFHRILQVFEEILRQDPLYEVVHTRHGYTLLAWEPNRKEWYGATLLETPENMLEALLDVYSGYMEQAITGGIRDDLTDQERQELSEQCRRLREKCLQNE